MHAIYLIILALYEVAVIVAIIHVITDNRQPVKTMAWALVIYFVPIIGLILYVFLGINTRKERIVSQRSLDQLSRRQMLGFAEQGDQMAASSGKHHQMISLFSRLSASLPFRGNRIDIFTDGYSYFLDLLKEIGRARHHIHIDQFIIDDDPLGMLLADALIDKARQGVEIRIVYDDVGCWHTRSSFFERLRSNGIEVCPFLPVRFMPFLSKVNYRNHRKLIIIDGLVGYIGGFNIALRYIKGADGKGWRDTMIKVIGQGTYGIQKSFLIDWFFVDQTLISNRKYYPTPPHEISNNLTIQTVTCGPTSAYPEIMQGFISAILSAKNYVFIETPYFLPTEPILLSLKTAALAGIDVRLIIPRKADSLLVNWACRSYIREAMLSGVKIYLYSPAFLHSKLMVVDDNLCTCGSTNIDFRSFDNNFEANAFIYDEETSVRFRDIFLDDLKSATCLNDVNPKKRPSLPIRLWEGLMRLVSPLL